LINRRMNVMNIDIKINARVVELVDDVQDALMQ